MSETRSASVEECSESARQFGAKIAACRVIHTAQPRDSRLATTQDFAVPHFEVVPGLVHVSNVSVASHPTGSEESSSPTGIVHFPTGDVTALTGHLRVLLSSHGLRDAQGLSARDSVARLTADPLPEWLPVIDAALACSDRDGTH